MSTDWVSTQAWRNVSWENNEEWIAQVYKARRSEQRDNNEYRNQKKIEK